jgi:8-oxo-dGTP diphosphatase
VAVDDAAFPDSYDPAGFERPSVAVDLILTSVVDGAPAVLLHRRGAPPHAGCWALPGGFVGIDESPDDAARRVLGAKARITDAYLEQLYTFGTVDRDPRMRVVSIAYCALLPAERFAAAPGLALARVVMPDGSAATAWVGGEPVSLAFDHAAMLDLAIRRLRGKLDWSPVAFALLPDRFTLRALQDVHEAILGRPVNKSAFRRRLIDSGRIAATGERETGASFRPAELYRYTGEP